MDAPTLDFVETWERVKLATGLQNISQLAKILNIKQPSVSKAKKKGAFPLKWALSIASGYTLNTDWVLFGIGPVHYGSPALKKTFDEAEKLKKLLDQAVKASTIEEYEVCLEKAEKLREKILSIEPLPIEEKARLADARILELEKENTSLRKEKEQIKKGLHLDPDPEISELMEGARRVLTSGNPIAFDALERNIRYFDHAIATEKELQEMKDDLVLIKKELEELKKQKSKNSNQHPEEPLSGEKAA